MKQFTLVIEAIIKDDQQTIIVREPRSGQVVKMVNDPKELASFLVETINSIKAKNLSSNDEKVN